MYRKQLDFAKNCHGLPFLHCIIFLIQNTKFTDSHIAGRNCQVRLKSMMRRDYYCFYASDDADASRHVVRAFAVLLFCTACTAVQAQPHNFKIFAVT